MTRFPDWPSRLQFYLDAHRDTPFKYGSYDCSLFVAGCIEAMTDIDPAEWFRGRYGSRRAAFDAIKERTGHKTILSIATCTAKQYGMEPVSISMAQRGDMILFGAGSKSTLGIVSLSGSDILAPGSRGLKRVPISNATKAWRV